MALVKATINSRARALLNESIAGFWTDAEINNWIDDAAMDISAKTYCYEQSTNITFITNTQLYSLPENCVKALGVIYSNKGLKRITPWMEGLQTAVVSGSPNYFFEITEKIGFVPYPALAQNGTTATLYYAKLTNDITKIIDKFQVPAILFVVMMGFLKERQYSKAGQLLQIYTASLDLDRTEIELEKVEQPAPQNNYVL